MMVPPKYVVAIAMATIRIVDATASRLLSSDKDSPKIVQLLSIEALCGLPVSRISMSVLCLAGRSQKSTPASSAIGLDVVIRIPVVDYRDGTTHHGGPALDDRGVGAAVSRRDGSGGAEPVADRVAPGRRDADGAGGAGHGLWGALDPGDCAALPGRTGGDWGSAPHQPGAGTLARCDAAGGTAPGVGWPRPRWEHLDRTAGGPVDERGPRSPHPPPARLGVAASPRLHPTISAPPRDPGRCRGAGDVQKGGLAAVAAVRVAHPPPSCNPLSISGRSSMSRSPIRSAPTSMPWRRCWSTAAARSRPIAIASTPTPTSTGGRQNPWLQSSGD